jgi:hypothetical protein
VTLAENFNSQRERDPHKKAEGKENKKNERDLKGHGKGRNDSGEKRKNKAVGNNKNGDDDGNERGSQGWEPVRQKTSNPGADEDGSKHGSHCIRRVFKGKDHFLHQGDFHQHKPNTEKCKI